MDEFALIDAFTSPFGAPRPPRGPGDDCAVLPPARGALCVTTDAVVEGVHFTRRHFRLEEVGHKALAVNLSDLASMGAEPRWFVCAVALPQRGAPAAVRALAKGMAPLARAHRIALVGGNFTAARELSVTITAAGEVPEGEALLRSGGRPGDLLYVTGTLGDARLGLSRLGTSRSRRAQQRQRRPTPRVALGARARRQASACIDVSDGLAGDLGHLCEASQVGAEVEVGWLPVSAELKAAAGPEAWRWALAGGEDYELLFAVPPRRARAFERACRGSGCALTAIGRLVAGRRVTFRSAGGQAIAAPKGFDHFAAI